MSSNKTQQKNLKVSVIKQISKSNFSVYLAQNPKDSQFYAMKVFPYEGEEVNTSFARELPAFSFKHNNVIKMVDYNPTIKTEVGDKKVGYSSYTIMELAPYGDLADLVMSKALPSDEKLLRTIFHHICEGTKYIHSKSFAHMDLKLENILVGENYIPKISDFDSLKDLSLHKKNEKISRLGTVNCRAPELANKECKNGFAADIYSLGIILFILQFGFLPYIEGSLYCGYDLQELLQESSSDFFKIHTGSKKLISKKAEAFKDLIFGMTKKNPAKRMTFENIIKNEWYAESIYSDSEFSAIMKANLE